MESEFRDVARPSEGIFDEVAEIEDETESGTFLVCWETGMDLGWRCVRPAYAPAMSSLFAGPFDGWIRKSVAAAPCYTIRSQVD